MKSCRLPQRDETNNDSAQPEFNLNPTDLSSSANESKSDEFSLGVNGLQNASAFASNQKVASSLPLNNFESQATELSPTSAPDSSQLLDSNTTTSEVPQAISPEAAHIEPESSTSAESAVVETAVEDSTVPNSTVPPIVEAPESDLRDDLPDTNSTASNLLLAQIESEIAPVPGTTERKNESESPPTNIIETAEPAVPANTEETAVDLSTSLPVDQSAEAKIEHSQAVEQQGAMEVDTEPQQEALDAGVAEEDSTMDDVPVADTPEAPSTKVAREREDDDEIEPAAKRTRTEESDTQPRISQMSDSIMNGERATPQPEGGPISQSQVKEIIKILKNAARTTGGKNFRAPVIDLWPNFAEAYAQKIEKQVDLLTIERNLKSGLYSSMAALKADIELIHANALTFNGVGHTITNAAQDVKKSILAKINSIPPEVAPPPKKDKKAKRPTPAPNSDAPSYTPVRRQSKGSHPTPTGPVSAPRQTFALDPNTSMPLIRRDSTKDDRGRPKREIIPPKNKDLIYSVRPKNKKFATELRFCSEVLKELYKPKHALYAGPFLYPVDPVALNIPTYFTIVKKPMDLSTVQKKLDEGAYTHASDFDKDVNQIFKNCELFNPPGNLVRHYGDTLKDVYKGQWARKDRWIADHAPVAATPPSAPESDEEEEEEYEERATSHDQNTVAMAKERLLEEQKKLIELMSAKHRDPSMVAMQQDLVDVIQKRVATEEQNAKQKVKKVKTVKAAPKKSVPPKRPAPKKAKMNKYMGTIEKETISNGIFELPQDVSDIVLGMIREDQPNLDVSTTIG